MIQPALADSAFLADMAAAGRDEPDALHLWWLGQSGFLIQWQSRHLLLDPYLSDTLTAKYAQTDKPHIRMSTRVVAPERLDFITLVTSSHNHTDHLDAETLGPILQASPSATLVIPEANRGFVADRLSLADSSVPVGMDDGTTITRHGITLIGVPAAHETIERDHAGRCCFLGYVARLGPWTIYHSGDTVLYDGMAERLRAFRPDIALLPINGRAPERRVAGNLDGREAARLAHEVSAGVVIPCHYDLFAFNTADPAEAFMPECERLGQPCRVLRLGERWTGRERRPG